ncbi:unnamed protein product [Sphagnum tenellum]
MDAGSNNIFPNIGYQCLPEIMTKILLHVSFTDNVHNLLMVSRGWKDFIDHEMLGRPNMKKMLLTKEFVRVWTRATQKEQKIKDRIPNLIRVTTSGSFIFCYRAATERTTVVYRNCELFGFLDNLDYHAEQSAPEHRFVPCRTRAYFVTVNGPGHQATNTLIVYRRKNQTMSFSRETVPLPGSRQERRLLLRSVSIDDRVVLLLCVDDDATDNIVIANLADGSEKTVAVSRIGSFGSNDGGGNVHLVADCHHMLIFWAEDNILQLIDHENGVEVWTRDVVVNPATNPYNRMTYKTAELSCILTKHDVGDRKITTMQFHGNETGDLWSCFSMRGASPKLFFVGRTAIFTLGQMPFVYCYKVWKGRLTKIPLKDICKHQASVQILGIVRDRILLVTYSHDQLGSGEPWCNEHSALVAYDLLDKEHPGPFILDSAGSQSQMCLFHCKYAENISRGRVVCFNYAGIRVLRFMR